MKCKTDDTLKYVLFLARHFDKQNIRAVTLVILFDLGFTPSNDGFGYLRQAIEMQYSKTTPTIIKWMYPLISASSETTDSWQYIDQAIRRAIKAAWDERDPELWCLFFPSNHNGIPKCPSNKEFISRISCIIELWQNCKEVNYERYK